MVQTIEARVTKLIQNNEQAETTFQTYYNRYTTDELPIDVRKTPKYINTDATNIEEDQRLVNAYDSEIVENRVNFVMSNPVIFQYDDENDADKDKYQDMINNWITEDGFNLKLRTLTEIAGASGQSGLLLYNNIDSFDRPMLKTKIVYPWEYILEWTEDETKVVGALKYWSQEELDKAEGEITTTTGTQVNTTTMYYGEFYTDGKIYYLKGKSKTGLSVVDEQDDVVSDIPLIELKNNEQRKPSFYKAMSLIDAYNGLISDYTNEMAGIRHAILALTGQTIKTENDTDDDLAAARRLKEIRMLFMEEGGKAEYITKEVKYEATEFILKQLEKNIERFTGNLNYSDPEVYGRATNLAITTRIKPLENQAKKLVMQLNDTLSRMFMLLGEYWNLSDGNNFDWRKVNFIYTFDRPINDVEEAQKLVQLSTLISKETLLSTASFINDPQAEMERIEKEMENESVDDDFNTRREPVIEDTES